MYRVGNGIDVHPLVKGRSLILGGVHIKHNVGCDGHSDGDVLIHSIIDALLGATGEGDIGDYFPSSDPKYEDIESLKLLSQIALKIKTKSWNIENIDSTIILQTPRLKSYIPEIIENIKKVPLIRDISIKATTTDYLGFIGEGKGIAVITTCLLKKE